ncbi:MAG TPA: peptide ABC transporter substrate-binding protein [Candidatus Baltobacteraceae bacterium]|jgi:peptide/nickel transport system substrate-binding protein
MGVLDLRRFAAVALILAFLAAGCTKNGGSSSNPGGRVNAFTVPHVLRYSTGEDFSTLNPLLTTQTTAFFMASLTMAWLIKWDVHNRPYPELLTIVPDMHNGGVSPDGKTIIYHLRKGVKWSDGVPFTADDVVWSFHAVLNPANNVTSRAGFDLITKIDEPDKYTVVLHMKKPYTPFVTTFFSTAGANPCVLPKHLLAQLPNINNAPYNALPVGIGPFKYKRWSRGSRVVMVANPLYFRGLPKLKEVDFEIIPDVNTVVTQLDAKELDLFYSAPPNKIDHLRTLAAYHVEADPSFYFRHLDFNLSHPVLADVAVRRALRYATDRKTIIQKLYNGVANLQDEPASQAAAYWDPNIPLTPFDIAKANQILDQAGWKLGADGVRAKNGVKLNLEVAVVSGDPVAASMMELIRGWWKQIGVSMNVRHYLSSIMFNSYANGGIIYHGKFDVAYFQWGADPLGDFSNLYACNQFPPNGQNDIHWCNKKASDATQAVFRHFDQTQRNADDAIVMEELNKDVPTVVITGTKTLWVWNKDLKNFIPNATSPFDNFMNVDI